MGDLDHKPAMGKDERTGLSPAQRGRSDSKELHQHPGVTFESSCPVKQNQRRKGKQKALTIKAKEVKQNETKSYEPSSYLTVPLQ